MIRMPAALKHFIGNAGGAVAIEFALILPVMVVMLTGLIELSYLMMAERRVSGAAHSTADLISQETDVTSTTLDDIFAAAALIMAPFDTANLTIGVSSVRFDDSTGNPFQDWSSAYNSGSVSNPTTLATGMGEAGSSVIRVVCSPATHTSCRGDGTAENDCNYRVEVVGESSVSVNGSAASNVFNRAFPSLREYPLYCVFSFSILVSNMSSNKKNSLNIRRRLAFSSISKESGKWIERIASCKVIKLCRTRKSSGKCSSID